MKVGSLVVCIQDPTRPLNEREISAGVTVCYKGDTIYTVRSISQCSLSKKHGITLEEIINPKVDYGHIVCETIHYISRFKEIQPPMDLTELIEESLLQPA